MGCCESTPKAPFESAVGEGKRAEEAGKNLDLQQAQGDDGFEDGDGGTMFFDAEQSFRDVVQSMIYPPASTMRARNVSMLSPDTLLSPANKRSSEADIFSSAVGEQGETITKPPVRESVVAITKTLQSDSFGVATCGYPGELTDYELEACLKFREELKKRDPAYKEMVHAYAPAEDEAFALCRFLRARAFDVDEIFKMLDEQDAITVWKKAREANFHRDLEAVYRNCPIAVILQLFPVVISGLAKNGATMFYFKPGNIDVNGLECVADLPELVPLTWYLLHTGGIDSMLRETKLHDPKTTTVLSERIIVVDMKNCPSALFNTEFMKDASKATACFPETMNRTYMLNVPTAFTVVWAVVKMFLEPRTIKKIGFFSRVNKAKEDLLRFVDSEELLSDYGGTGPSFDDALKLRQAELGSCSRYIVETMTVSSKESSFTFELAGNEKVSFIRVFSKGKSGSDISVQKEDQSVVVRPTRVEMKDRDSTHYSAELDSSKIQAGPGAFKVVARGSAKEYYLVAIGVSSV
jgi:hypothetical protein